MPLVFLITIFFLCISSASQAVDVECVKKNFDKYIKAQYELHKYPLQFIKDQPPKVQQAVNDEVDYQLAYIEIQKSIFDVIIKDSSSLKDLTRIGLIPWKYIEGYCKEKIPDKAICETTKVNASLSQNLQKLFEQRTEFNNALKKLNELFLKKAQASKEQKLEAQKNKNVIYGKIRSDMFKLDAAKIVQDVANKPISELDCKI